MHRPVQGLAGRSGFFAAALLLSATILTGPADAQLFGNRAAPVPPGNVGVLEAQSPAAVAEQSMRVDRVEEQMRQLNGRIDELTFQLQQLQEMLRRSQEDAEFRFQELEGGTGRPQPQQRSEAPAGAPGGATGSTEAGQAPAPTDLQTGFTIDAQEQVGDPPRVLGTVPGDASSSAPPSESAVGGPLDLSAIASGNFDYQAPATVAPTGTPNAGAEQLPATTTAPEGNQQMAAIVQPEDARTAYDRAYGYVVAGDYDMAEMALKQYLEDHPGTPQTSNALFWLGESFFARNQFRDAADAFLTTYRDYPTSNKAPESLLKLGLSLEGLGETDAACATYGELVKKYPDAPGALRGRVEQQQAKAGC